MKIVAYIIYVPIVLNVAALFAMVTCFVLCVDAIGWAIRKVEG